MTVAVLVGDGVCVGVAVGVGDALNVELTEPAVP
jgi:hypothetical protein